MIVPRARVAWQTVALIAVCTVCMWPTESTVPGPGLDRAWSVGLALARAKGLRFGDEIVFTYGPLGHAYFPSSITRSGLLISIVVISTLCTVFIALSHRLLRLNNGSRRFALGAAFFLVLIGPSSGAALGDVAVFALFATMIDALARSRAVAAWWYPALGAAAAALLLGKVSTGIISVLGLGVFALAGADRWKRLGTAAGGFLVALALLWVGTGQQLGQLPRWLRGVFEISDGYSAAMGREEPGRQWELAVVGIVAASLLFAGGRYLVRRRGSADQALHHGGGTRTGSVDAAVVMLVLGLFEFAFKEGFIRHDIHSGIFFLALVYVATVLPRWSYRSIDAWPAAVGWLTTVLALLISGGVTVSAALDPTPSARAFVQVVNSLIDSDGWRDELSAGRAAARDAYQVPTEILVAGQGESVHVDPYDLQVVWAYDLQWDPTPVFQRYTAYTPYLDRLNADHLQDAAGPSAVLRSTDAPLDDRFDFLEAPLSMQVMLCNFAATVESARWQLLNRVGERCHVAASTPGVATKAGTQVALPEYDPATQAVLIRAEFDTGVVDVVGTMLYKSADYHITVAGRRYRVLPRMTDVPGLLYVPPTSGWADQFRGLTDAPADVQFDHDATVSFTIVDVAPS